MHAKRDDVTTTANCILYFFFIIIHAEYEQNISTESWSETHLGIGNFLNYLYIYY